MFRNRFEQNHYYRYDGKAVEYSGVDRTTASGTSHYNQTYTL